MNDLYQTMGIKSPSLYAVFGSKEDLYDEVLQHYEQTLTRSGMPRGCNSYAMGVWNCSKRG